MILLLYYIYRLYVVPIRSCCDIKTRQGVSWVEWTVIVLLQQQLGTLKGKIVRALENGKELAVRNYTNSRNFPSIKNLSGFALLILGILIGGTAIAILLLRPAADAAPPKVVMRSGKIEWKRTESWSGNGSFGFSTYPAQYVKATFVGESQQYEPRQMKNIFDEKPGKAPGFELDPLEFETEYGKIVLPIFFAIDKDHLMAKSVVKNGEWRVYLERRGDQWVNIPYPQDLIEPIREKAVDKMLDGDSISKEEALAEWQSAGRKVMYVLRRNTSSYHDAGLNEWSFIKHHGGGDWPILEDHGSYIKSGMMKEGKFKTLYFKKSDLTTDWLSTEWAKSQGGKPTQVDLLD